MVSISFLVTPQKIKFGESTTLRWDIEGVRAIFLDGQGVTGHESRVVSPASTTTYSLHIVLRDNSVINRTVTVEVEGDTISRHDKATREPTVILTPENISHLQQYPRPPRDNGRGLHFHLDLRDESIAQSVSRLQFINATWTLIYAQDELQAQRAARACWAVGIMPVVRIGKRVDEFFDPAEYVKALQSVGAPPYVQIYNEPSDHREWEPSRPDNYLDIFASRWAGHAATVFDAGGYPGLQVMSRGELFATIQAVENINRQDIWERTVFIVHNYGVNHPPGFPYDERNQQDNPGQTVLDDPVAALAPVAFAHWMQERIGFVLPIIGGEGGWQYGVFNDQRYPKVEQPFHAHYHREMFEWFQAGTLSNGEPLPDYLFSITPWILGGWHTSEDWWDGPLGTHTETIEAVRRIPPFIRRFSWDNDSASTQDSDLVVETPPSVEPSIIEPEPSVEEPTLSEPALDLEWDPRLDALGVRLTRTTESPAWRLIKAVYRDHTESDNRHHIDIIALRENGDGARDIKFTVDWIGRQPHENPGVIITDEQGKLNHPIFNNLHPELKDGVSFAMPLDEPGDRVDGMGLPNNHHVSYELTYQFK